MDLKNLKKKNYKIGLAHGVFDLVHAGHILHFEECKKYCDILIVSVTDDKFISKGPGRPYFSVTERIRFLKSIKFIDHVIVNSEFTPINLIKNLKPNFYFKGNDYVNFSKDLTGNIIKEKKEVKKNGGEIIFTKSKLKSSSSILNNEFKILDDDIKKILKSIDKEKIINFLNEKINKKPSEKILILGEAILDKYTYVETLGKSHKNQIIVTKYKHEKIYGGGSLLASIFLEKLFNRIDLVTIENDFNKKFYKKFLNKYIGKIGIKDKSSKLTIKNRFINFYRGERLYQINHNDNQRLLKSSYSKISSLLKKSINTYDKIIIFDFGHGLINSDILKIINKNSQKFLINCQSNSSNFGFNLATKYQGGNTICMDEMEFRLCVNDNENSIQYLIKKNNKFTNKFNNFVITMGKYGCYAIKNKKIFFVPTIYKKTKDTIGSGDIFFSTFAFLITSSKLNINEIIILSHISAGLHSIQEGNLNENNLKDILRIFINLLK